jgi:uncharacterized protein (TIGR03067 family)
MRAKLVTVLAVGLLIAADKPADDAAKKDLESLQGEWTLASGERDGEKFPDEFVKSLKRTVQGNKSVVTRDGQSLAESTVTLDPTKKPKAIDIKLAGGDEMIKGIYELEGDTFKICYAMPGSDRPKEFATKEGSGLTLGVWKKVKK